MDYKGLQKQLKANKISPVYLFTGPETGIADMMTEEIVAHQIPSGMEMLNLSKYDQKDIDYSEVFASCETLPVMSPARIIVLGLQADAMSMTDEAFLERLETYLNNPSPSTTLIIYSIKPDKRRKIYNLIKKKAQIVEFNKMNYAGISSWIKNRLKKLKKEITKPALDMFIERTHYLENENVDTLSVDSELERLADFVGDNKKITEQDVEEVIPEGTEDNVFKLIDKVVTGQLDDVHGILEYFWDHGESPIGLFALLLYQLRNIIKVNILLRRGLAQNAIASKTHLAPFVVRKVMPISRRYSTKRLYELLEEAADLDFKVKTGQVDPAFALELFLLKMNKTK